MVEAPSIVTDDPPKKTPSRKRKKKTKSPVEPKNIKLDETSEKSVVQKTESPQVAFESLSMDKINEKYPVLKNEELVEKFMKVPLNNNQKGRIRQVLRDNLKGTSEYLLPDVLNNKIQAVLTKTTELSDTDLRKIRILYNMLKTAIMAEKGVADKKIADKKIAKEKKLNNKDKSEDSIEKIERPESIKADVKEVKKEQLVQKVKGKKRYVVFIGNLPLGVNKETLMSHFSELSANIVDLRMPPPRDDKNSAIAYLELKDEPTYEMALSKHHSMLGTKRIKVLYSTQQGTKISKTEAKSKSAKLVALQKSGALIGSTALAKKRSQRRAKLRKARAAEEKANA